jgi:hypothetical protein
VHRRLFHLWVLAGSVLLDRARFGSPPVFWRCVYLAVAFLRRREVVRVYRGFDEGRSRLTLAVAAPRSLASELAGILLEGPVDVAREGRRGLRRPARLAAGADLEAALVHAWHAGRWRRAGWTVVPRRVRFELPSPAGWRPPASRRERSLQTDVCRAERGGFDVEEAPAREALAEFRERMVTPHARLRFGRDAATWVGRWAARGTILFVRRGGVRVAGILLVPRGRRLVLLRLGVLDGRDDLVRDGALGAVYLAAIRWGARHGFATLDGGMSSAFRQDGIHRYKRKWRFIARDPGFTDRVALLPRTEAGRRALERLLGPEAAQHGRPAPSPVRAAGDVPAAGGAAPGGANGRGNVPRHRLP